MIRNKSNRIVQRLLVASILILPLLLLMPGCGVRYVATQGYYQGKLLLGRVDVEKAMTLPEVSEKSRERMRLIQELRVFGEQELGLLPTDNYTSINLEWNQEIWNVSGCRELKFESHTWWFPIVGRVPYKGFFRKPDAEAEVAWLKKKGFETSMRKIAGYSTLGWFKDPILPPMLNYSDSDLANLILHELAHATLFIPGHIDFNESFASFVGDEAALRFLAKRFGSESAELVETRSRYRDEELFRQFMHDLFQKLDRIYGSSMPDDVKRQKKSDVLSGLNAAVKELPFESQAFKNRRMPNLNNADLLQYRRYNSAGQHFAHLLEQVGGDTRRFFEALTPLKKGKGDPFESLQRLIQP